MATRDQAAQVAEELVGARAGSSALAVALGETDEPGLFEGVSLRVVLGVMKYAPVQYFSFDVGPFEMTVTIEEDERLSEAYDKAMRALRAIAAHETERALQDHLSRCRRAIEQSKAQGLGAGR